MIITVPGPIRFLGISHNFWNTYIPVQTQHKKSLAGTSLVVQQVRLCSPNAGGTGLIPGQGTRSRMLHLRACMPQLRACTPQLKIPHATTKIPHTAMKIPNAATKNWHSQINKYFFKKRFSTISCLTMLLM